MLVQARALLLPSHQQEVKLRALPHKRLLLPHHMEQGAINIAGCDVALVVTHLDESFERNASEKSSMDIDTFESDGMVSSFDKNQTSPYDFIVSTSAKLHDTLNNLIIILPYQTTSVVSMSNEVFPTHLLVKDNKKYDSNHTTTPMNAISSKLKDVIHLIKKSPEFIPPFSALCHHHVMSDTSPVVHRLDGPAPYIGILQLLHKLLHGIVCNMARQLQQLPNECAIRNQITLGLWDPDIIQQINLCGFGIDFSEGWAVAKVIHGRAGPYFSQAVGAWLNYFSGFRGDSILLEDALMLAFLILYLAMYFFYLFHGDSLFGIPCCNEKPHDFSTYSFLFGVDEDDDEFPLCAAAADDDDDEFPLLAGGGGGGDDDSLCYSLDSDVADSDNFSCVDGDDGDDELSVFSIDSAADGDRDIDNDFALPVIESSCSAVTLPAIEASCSAPQLRRSPRIAKMKHVCYKTFF